LNIQFRWNHESYDSITNVYVSNWFSKVKKTIVIMIIPVDSINMMPSERPQRHTAAVCQYSLGKSMGICGLMFLHLMKHIDARNMKT
jgi:hypothetical protein